VSRNMEFHGEAFHGTTANIAKQVAGSQGLLLSDHGAAGPGAYVAPEIHQAQAYGDYIFSGEAHARKVMPAEQYRATLDKYGSRPGYGHQIREHLLRSGYDGVEDATVRGAVALLHPGSFQIREVYHPEQDRWIHPAELEDRVARPRRASQRSSSRQFDRLWAPETFGN